MKQSVLAGMVVLAVLGMLWSRTTAPPLGLYDQPFYLGIAYDLEHAGRFTDGYRFAGPGPASARPSSMRFTPLYPALLAAAARVDAPMRRDVDCLVETDGGSSCGRHAVVARGLQFVLLAAACWLVWWQAARVARDMASGWVALVLLLLAAPLLLRSVDTLMTETLTLFLCVGAEALALLALTGPGGMPGKALLTSGVFAGGAVLCRPGLVPVCIVLCLAGLSVSALGRGSRFNRSAWQFALGCGLVVSPWVARNMVEFGRVSVSFGYASHTLVQRLSFDAMTGREWGMAFACWLPDGSGLGRLIDGPGACDRFGWDEHKDSFYAIGLGPMLRQTLAASGGWDGHMSYLVRTFLLARPAAQLGWHAAVSLPLALRGMTVNHWEGVALGLLCLWRVLAAVLRRDEADRRFLLVAVPPLLALVLNAAIAVNQPRYNLLLLLPFSVAGALLVRRPGGFAPRLTGRFPPRTDETVVRPVGPPDNIPDSGTNGSVADGERERWRWRGT